jgi:predicted RNA-binding protein with PUA-like domain
MQTVFFMKTDIMNYWLMKSEPSVYSIDDLKRDKVTGWDGVRNYQARNIMRDQMQVGDLALFYHSNATPPGVAGLMRVVREAYPDATAWDQANDHYDPRSTPENPVWLQVDLEYVSTFPAFVSLPEIKADAKLEGIMVAQRGARLSVQPVSAAHFAHICLRGGVDPGK